jgi:hypothetical protein
MREGWQRPRLEGDYPYGFQKHLRPEAMPKEFEAKGPAVVGPVPSREFCENCNCPHCTRMKEQLRQQDMHQKAREKSQDEEYSTKRPDTNEGDFDWDW